MVEPANLKMLRDRVYEQLGELIRSGQFAPGEKLTIRNLAKDFEMSTTPVREALYRLISEGVLLSEANRSALIPLLTREQICELRDIRLHVECFAAERAAQRGTPESAGKLRAISNQLKKARAERDRRAYLVLVYRFQFELYGECRMPNLLKIINSLWLKSGPYLNLLFPHYVSSISTARGNWRQRIAVGVENQDSAVVAEEIRREIGQSLTYIADIVDAAAILRPFRG